jgi:hypothetical protein
MAEQPSWLDDALARAKTSAAQRAPDSISPMALSPAAPLAPSPATSQPAAAHLPKRRVLPRVLGAMVLLLMGAACGIAFRGRLPDLARWVPRTLAARHAEPPAAMPSPIPSPIAVPVRAPAAPAPIGAAKNDAPAAASADPVLVYEADDPAPAIVAKDAKASHRSRRSSPHPPARGVHAANPAPVTAAAASTPPEPDPTPAPAPAADPPASKSALDSALRAAAGSDAEPAAPAPPPAPAPAAPTPVAKASAPAADVPERPSGSAVTGALTPALSAARACIAATTEPSRAKITFGSDGSVQSVTATSPAGDDRTALDCLRRAFGGAHVPAFSQSSYSASVTLRPR